MEATAGKSLVSDAQRNAASLELLFSGKTPQQVINEHVSQCPVAVVEQSLIEKNPLPSTMSPFQVEKGSAH